MGQVIMQQHHELLLTFLRSLGNRVLSPACFVSFGFPSLGCLSWDRAGRWTSLRLCCKLRHCTKHGENSIYFLKNSYKSPPACFGMGNPVLWRGKLVQRATCSRNLVALCAGMKSWFGVTGKKASGAGGLGDKRCCKIWVLGPRYSWGRQTGL